METPEPRGALPKRGPPSTGPPGGATAATQLINLPDDEDTELLSDTPGSPETNNEGQDVKQKRVRHVTSNRIWTRLETLTFIEFVGEQLASAGRLPMKQAQWDSVVGKMNVAFFLARPFEYKHCLNKWANMKRKFLAEKVAAEHRGAGASVRDWQFYSVMAKAIEGGLSGQTDPFSDDEVARPVSLAGVSLASKRKALESSLVTAIASVQTYLKTTAETVNAAPDSAPVSGTSDPGGVTVSVPGLVLGEDEPRIKRRLADNLTTIPAAENRVTALTLVDVERNKGKVKEEVVPLESPPPPLPFITNVRQRNMSFEAAPRSSSNEQTSLIPLPSHALSPSLLATKDAVPLSGVQRNGIFANRESSGVAQSEGESEQGRAAKAAVERLAASVINDDAVQEEGSTGKEKANDDGADRLANAVIALATLQVEASRRQAELADKQAERQNNIQIEVAKMMTDAMKKMSDSQNAVLMMLMEMRKEAYEVQKRSADVAEMQKRSTDVAEIQKRVAGAAEMQKRSADAAEIQKRLADAAEMQKRSSDDSDESDEDKTGDGRQTTGTGPTNRFDGVGHEAVRIGRSQLGHAKERVCKVCDFKNSRKDEDARKKRSVFQCKKCRVALCFPECFTSYHQDRHVCPDD
eukprot:TRINITY_DN3883_c0_g2_i1.p1 TRINITY_DN3883_c0_g2~~TRINITY_DN3883_c0_g2_i1.p1  ORF type:complete len:636 (-),score=85.88 TRINITY_DN3883_c0_g2_i1:706-2613(-)